MSILKGRNFNKYFQHILLAIFLFALSLVPWIEFVNTNFDEIDFIFNNNFLILLIIYYLLIITIFFILKNFSSLKRFSLVSFITISIWILFQHNFIKINSNFFFKKLNISNQYSSELALVLILAIIFIVYFLIKKNKFFTNFFIFFLTLNFCFSSFHFSTEYISQINKSTFNNPQEKSSIKSGIKRPNIYFFILDGMMPLDEFENYYQKNLVKFKNFFVRNEYIYFNNTQNLYPDTTYALTSLFFLEDIFIEYGNYDEKTNLKPNIYKKFPSVLKKQYNPKLISELNKLGYKFKWIGNSFADCSKYNYEYCLTNKKEEYIDLYLLQSFLQKTPIIQIFNKLTEPEIIQKYLKIDRQGDAIGKLRKFLVSGSNKDYIDMNSTFFFVHHMHPHWPYKTDKNCNYKNFPGNLNFEGYENSYLCVVREITDMIKIIQEKDNDAIVVFQSDHSWEMSKISAEKYGDRRQIFNLVRNNIKCYKPMSADLNNVKMANYLINCLKENN